MKYILTAFVASAVAAMSFTLSEKVSFDEFFRIAFTKSYDGLDKMKDAETGTWEFERSIGDFDQCNIRYDLEKGVHAVDFLMKMDNEETARQYVARYAIQVERAIPDDHYKRSETNTASARKVVFDYSSQDVAVKAKNPEVQLTTTKRDGGTYMVITLFEPFNRQKAGE